MEKVFRFLGGSTGRAIRVVAGLILIVVGIWAVQGVGGWILAIVGLVPLLAGAFDRCVFAPLLGLPFEGPDLRHALEDEGQD
jgi:hypothetical protein